jgi:hypothetical protein
VFRIEHSIVFLDAHLEYEKINADSVLRRAVGIIDREYSSNLMKGYKSHLALFNDILLDNEGKKISE